MILLCYLFLGVFLILIISYYLRKTGWSLFVYSTIYLFLFYVLTPIISLLIFNTDIINNLQLAYNIPNQADNELMILTFLAIFIGLSFFLIGYNRNIKINITKILPKQVGNKNLPTVFILIIFFLSLIGLFLYIRGFGSISSAIANANLVRSGYYLDVSDGNTSHTFFFRFIFLALIPLLYFYFNKKISNSLRYPIIVGCFIILGILYFFLSPGRQSIFDLILIFIFATMLGKRQVINKKILFFGILVFFLLPILNSFFIERSFNSINYSNSILEVILNEFGFPYYSLSHAINENYSYFYFSDFLSGSFGRIFPSSWNPGIESSNYLNSSYMLGRSVKSIPPGILAQGFYSLGFVGIIIVSFFTGIIFKVLDTYFAKASILNANFNYIYAYFIVSSMVWVRTGLPANYFYNLTFMTFIIFFFTMYKFKNS
ncbi:oligosaccharide repeat unit polymerase [Nonlabens sp. SCSIO 43208]|uniref:O-antigen polymerase n=1 Tax=Nonlabens sp. SCSIO 43208 TaxID=2793009 RepID=UPI003D6BC7CA